MKKILLLFSIILFPAYLFGQSGDGKSVSTAYYGTISSTVTWTVAYNGGIIYVGQNQSGQYDLIIGDNGNLIIDPGVTVIFCTNLTDLIVTGTGTLTADGTPSNIITFTRDSPNINYWGHISFQSMGSAGASLFDNCVIEYGDVRGNSSPASYGGGIYADFSSITISNCKIQHNKAEWGGGLFVNQNRSPYIANCIFYDNFSKEGGGGIYCWNGSSPVIENSVFDSNHCDGTSASYYTGGGVASQSNCSITLNNCTFVNNTSNRTDGQSLMLFSSINDKAINCILWGSGSHLYLSGSNTVNFCAIEGSAPSGTGNFVLNSSNTAPDGPNFTDPGNRDFSILFVSPCRDAGTSSGTPTKDINGNPRIGNYDIGAWEVQYSRWTGSTSTTWATSTNWDASVDPSLGTGDVVIPTGLTNYPTGSTSQNFTIGSGKSMTLNPGAKATFGTLTNNGDLKLMSDDSNISSLIVSTFSGNATVDLFLTGGGGSNYKWHYVSSPVTSLPVSTFAPTPTIDFAQWVEARPILDIGQGWVAYDGYAYFSGTFDLAYDIRGTNLIVGKGYNYYKSSDQKITFPGTLNTGDVAIGITFGGNATYHGFNLLGNPFSSGLNWDDITNGTYSPYPSNTSKGLYFTRDNAQCSYIAGVGYPDASVTGIIPPMQGFFIRTSNTSTTITLPAAARAHNIPARYKGSEIIPLVRLQLDNDSLKDNTVIRFDSKAGAGLDNDFDAIRMFLVNTKQFIYSSLGGTKYAINGQPFPATFVEIPIVVNLTTSGNHTISNIQLQGLDGYNVTLTDKTTGFKADLKTTTDLTFSASAGTITDRFVLKVGNILTGIEDPVVSRNTFNIYPTNNFINIQTISDTWDGKIGTVRVMDLTGKNISNLNNIEFSKNSMIQVDAPAAKGLYVVEIRSGVLRYVGKVIIR